MQNVQWKQKIEDLYRLFDKDGSGNIDKNDFTDDNEEKHKKKQMNEDFEEIEIMR